MNTITKLIILSAGIFVIVFFGSPLGQDSLPYSPNEPETYTNEQILAATESAVGSILERNYPVLPNNIGAVTTWDATVQEMETAWDCGHDKYWVVIGTCSITDPKSHYYHVTIGVIDAEIDSGDVPHLEVGKLSTCPVNQYGNWNVIFESESYLIDMGAIWPSE